MKLAGKIQNLDPMWKLLNEEVDLGEPTSFLDHYFLGWPWEMGSPRQVPNRRRRTREGPEPACVQTPSGFRGGSRRERRMNQHPAVVPSSRRGRNLQ